MLERAIDPTRLSHDAGSRTAAARILSIQAMGLKKRLKHTGCRHAVVGISGGLDSTLAPFSNRARLDLLGIP